MRNQGIQFQDQVLQLRQVHWLFVNRRECPDEPSERRIIHAFFRVAHEPWSQPAAFVCPVQVRRSRRRILFRQESGITP
jgi:hypothetical protein